MTRRTIVQVHNFLCRCTICRRGVSGLPRDIAAAAVFLASDDARHINCHDLVVDGGMIAGGRTNFEEDGHQPVKPGSPT